MYFDKCLFFNLLFFCFKQKFMIFFSDAFKAAYV